MSVWKKKKRIVSEDKRMVHSKQNTLVYLCSIPMQYGVKSYSRHWYDSACLDKIFGEPIQSDVTVIK